MIDIEKQNKIFFDKLAKYYDAFFGNWIKKMQMRVIKSFEIKNRAKILDAGCGTGNLLSLLENYDDLELYGVDISKEMIRIARSKLIKTKLKISSVEEFNFKNNYFDYVFSVDAFHHYSNKEKSMENFYRILKRNGKLIVVDIDFGRYFNRIFQKLEPGNNGVYTKDDMNAFFEKYNFRDIGQERAGLFTLMTVGIK